MRVYSSVHMHVCINDPKGLADIIYILVYACIWYACIWYANSMKIQKIVSRSAARRPATVDSHRFSVVFDGFMLSCLRLCWFSVGFVTPRTSWGSWRDLGEVWGISGAPRVGFGTFRGDLGGSQGGVQSSLLGLEYVTNTQVLELLRFLMKWRVFLVFIVFHDFG